MGKFNVTKDGTTTEMNVDMDNYIDMASRTNNPDYQAVSERLSDLRTGAIASVGIKEVGTLLDTDLDMIKKHIFYGKKIDDYYFSKLSQLDSGGHTEDNIPNMDRFKNNPEIIDILHGVLGIATEAGEMLKALSKYIATGELDKVNLIEEVSDVMWYQAVLLKRLGKTFEECGTINISKLAIRYPDGFTNDLAINRDVAKERIDMESKISPNHSSHHFVD